MTFEHNEDYDGLKLVKQSFDSLKLTKIRVSNSVFEGCSFIGTDMSDSSFIKTTFKNCNFTGTQLSQSLLRESAFIDCKLDLATLMFCTFKSTVLEGCQLKEVKLGSSKFTGKSGFYSCLLEQVDFHEIHIDKDLGFKESQFLSAYNTRYLKNATISTIQLNQLASDLAVEFGLKVID